MSLAGEASDSKNYFNQDDILKKWGFDDSTCHYCGKKNSELAGLLMQCGKCKKAYYCGMKCFNADLPKHQNFCTTKAFYTEPKKGEFTIASPKLNNIVSSVSDLKDFMADLPIERKPEREKSFRKSKPTDAEKTPKTPKKEKVKKEKKEEKTRKRSKSRKKSKRKEESDDTEKLNKKKPLSAGGDDDETDDDIPSNDEVSSVDDNIPLSDVGGRQVVTPSSPKEVEELDEEEEEVIVSKDVQVTVKTTVQMSPTRLSPKSPNDRNYKIKPGIGHLPESNPFERETVDLRKAERRESSAMQPFELPKVDLNVTEIQSHEYEWEKPDWVNANLRPTEVGEKIKLSGDVIDPSLKSSSSNQQKYGWAKPEWATGAKLKKTGTGEMLKQGVDVLALATPVKASRRQSELGAAGLPSLNMEEDEDLKLEVLLKQSGIDIDSKIHSIQWQKPEWTKEAMLRKTGMLDQLKEGARRRRNVAK